MGKISKILKILFAQKATQQSEAAKKGALMRAHEKELEIWQRMVETLEHENNQLRAQKTGSMEEMLMSAVISMFAPGANNSIQPQSTLGNYTGEPVMSQETQQLESGVKYSDEQIKNLLGSMPPQYLQGIATQPLGVFKKIAKKQVPNLSEESITRAHALAKQMVKK